ncbi:MAG: glycosyltransferase family 1 protein [Dehalococcoidia bacterium]|nr:glycosyltransferase family 1 protein [Dehalococcoidia bacterium]
MVDVNAAPPIAAPRRIALLSLHTSPLAALGGRETGGMNVYVREVAARLAALGIPVDVFTRRSSTTEQEVRPISPAEDGAPGARLVQVTAGPKARIEKEEMLPFAEAFADGVEAFRAREGVTYDVIYSHYWLAAVAGAMLAERWGVPHAAMFHTLAEVKLRARASESEPRERIEAERQLVGGLDRIIAATEHERRLLTQIYRVPADRVAVVPLGVDLDQFRPRSQAEARAALGIDPAEQMVLAVGRIEPLKGFDILIRAIAQLSDRRRVVLWIIGGDERADREIAALRAVAAEVGVGDAVRFLGPRPHEALPAYYSAAAVVAVPSFYESFGLVAVEAMASGVPVVASRVGGLASTVADGRTGYLIPWRCPEPFAEKIELLLRNPELRRALGQAATERMRFYSWVEVARAVSGVLGALIAEHAAEYGAVRAVAGGGRLPA